MLEEFFFLVLKLTGIALGLGLLCSILLGIVAKHEADIDFSDIMNPKGLFLQLPLIVFLEEIIRFACTTAFLFIGLPFLLVLLFSGIIDGVLHLSNLKQHIFFRAYMGYYLVHVFLGSLFAYFLIIFGLIVQIFVHYLYDLITLSLGWVGQKREERQKKEKLEFIFRNKLERR